MLYLIVCFSFISAIYGKSVLNDDTLNLNITSDHDGDDVLRFKREDSIKNPEQAIKLHPYTVSISKVDQHRCSGAIISTKWVLSAAQCLDYVKVADIVVRAGSAYSMLGGTLAEVQEVINHPLYRQSAFYPEHALAMLLLTKPLEFSELISYVYLPDHKAELLMKDAELIVTGFGNTLTETDTNAAKVFKANGPMRRFRVQTSLTSKCRILYSQDFYLQYDNFCLISEGPKLCPGDSGDPAVFYPKYATRGIIYGIAIYSGTQAQCAHRINPGIYVKVSFSKKWIDEVVASHGERVVETKAPLLPKPTRQTIKIRDTPIDSDDMTIIDTHDGFGAIPTGGVVSKDYGKVTHSDDVGVYISDEGSSLDEIVTPSYNLGYTFSDVDQSSVSVGLTPAGVVYNLLPEEKQTEQHLLKISPKIVHNTDEEITDAPFITSKPFNTQGVTISYKLSTHPTKIFVHSNNELMKSLINNPNMFTHASPKVYKTNTKTHKFNTQSMKANTKPYKTSTKLYKPTPKYLNNTTESYEILVTFSSTTEKQNSDSVEKYVSNSEENMETDLIKKPISDTVEKEVIESTEKSLLGSVEKRYTESSEAINQDFSEIRDANSGEKHTTNILETRAISYRRSHHRNETQDQDSTEKYKSQSVTMSDINEDDQDTAFIVEKNELPEDYEEEYNENESNEANTAGKTANTPEKKTISEDEEKVKSAEDTNENTNNETEPSQDSLENSLNADDVRKVVDNTIDENNKREVTTPDHRRLQKELEEQDMLIKIGTELEQDAKDDSENKDSEVKASREDNDDERQDLESSTDRTDEVIQKLIVNEARTTAAFPPKNKKPDRDYDYSDGESR